MAFSFATGQAYSVAAASTFIGGLFLRGRQHDVARQLCSAACTTIHAPVTDMWTKRYSFARALYAAKVARVNELPSSALEPKLRELVDGLDDDPIAVVEPNGALPVVA